MTVPITPQEPGAGSASAASSVPRPLLILIAAVGLEILALVIAGGFALFEMTRPGATIGADLFLAAFGWGMALLLFFAVRGLVDGKRWGRSPVMTWQLFQIVIAVTWLTAVVHVGGVVLLLLAVVVIGTLMSRTVVEATTRDSRVESGDSED